LIAGFHDTAAQSLGVVDPQAQGADAAARDVALRDTEAAYQQMKAGLLEAGAQGRLPVEAMDACLRAGSAMRGAFEQATKAARILASDEQAHFLSPGWLSAPADFSP
jgi:hypothetical protein